MRVEPPRAQGARRRAPAPVLTQVSATARRAGRTRPTEPLPSAVRDAALAAAAALLATGRGDVWIVALALGVAANSAMTTLTVVLAGVATLARVGSAGLADIAGNQAVLGAAGVTGSTVAIAAAWTSAASLALAGRTRTTGAVLGALGGLLVAGPAIAGGRSSALVWTAGLLGGGAVGFALAATPARERWQPWLAAGVGAVAVGLGVAAGYN